MFLFYTRSTSASPGLGGGGVVAAHLRAKESAVGSVEHSPLLRLEMERTVAVLVRTPRCVSGQRYEGEKTDSGTHA